jgi:hypothetical protein
MSSSRRARSRRLKRILANIFLVVLAIVSLLLLIGLFLPRSYRVERSAAIRATADRVYADLANLRRWPEWTVWNQDMDPSVRFTFGTNDTGAGASYAWVGEKLGTGELTLTGANPTNGVTYNLEFEGGDMRSNGSITLEPQGEGVRVVWVNQGDLGKNPVNRYFGLWIDSMLGSQLEQGLSNLQRRAEQGVGP